MACAANSDGIDHRIAIGRDIIQFLPAARILQHHDVRDAGGIVWKRALPMCESARCEKKGWISIASEDGIQHQ